MKPIKLVMIALWALALASVAAFVVVRMGANRSAASAEEYVPSAMPSQADDGSLPRLFAMPEFELTEHTGETFSSNDLDGKVYVAFLFLTHCPTGACPVMVTKMADLQEALPDPRIEFVSFTVDPERDTPEAMAEYVKTTTGGEPSERWHLLTGESVEQMNDLAMQMRMPNRPDFTHSTRFLLVDGDGFVRGLYSNEDAQEMTRLAEDARQLLADQDQ